MWKEYDFIWFFVILAWRHFLVQMIFGHFSKQHLLSEHWSRVKYTGNKPTGLISIYNNAVTWVKWYVTKNTWKSLFDVILTCNNADNQKVSFHVLMSFSTWRWCYHEKQKQRLFQAIPWSSKSFRGNKVNKLLLLLWCLKSLNIFNIRKSWKFQTILSDHMCVEVAYQFLTHFVYQDFVHEFIFIDWV